MSERRAAVSARKRSVYRIPALLAGASGIGLVVALMSDGIMDALSCGAIALPLIICAWHLRRSWKARL